MKSGFPPKIIKKSLNILSNYWIKAGLGTISLVARKVATGKKYFAGYWQREREVNH